MLAGLAADYVALVFPCSEIPAGFQSSMANVAGGAAEGHFPSHPERCR